MLVDANSSTAAAGGVTGAIQKAARLTGTSFHYLLAAAKVESNLDPNAAASTSSAGGLFQFIEQTWLGTLKDAGGSLGYGRYANAIQQNSSGRFVVSDPAMRAEIMNLRKDPTANAVMAGAFTKANASLLTQKLGRAPSEGELYMAHFLGAGGAAKLIRLAAATPNASASETFPVAARANRSIFYGSNGQPRSFAQVTQVLGGRYDVARSKEVPVAAAAEPATVAALPAETARVARAYEAAAPESAKSVMPPPLIPPSVDISSAGSFVARPPSTSTAIKSAMALASVRARPVHDVVKPVMKPTAAAPVVRPAAAPAPAAPPVAAAAVTPPVAKTTTAARTEDPRMFRNPFRQQAAAAIPAPTAVKADMQPGVPVQMPVAVPAAAPANDMPAAEKANVKAPAPNEPLGLFQDIRPNVGSLFRGV